MDHSNPSTTVRHDGWTEARRTAFLEHLAACGNVRAASARAGMSHEAAYRLRRRDALFARGWDAALVLARGASAEVLACRALDGVEEEVWHRGELVGTRRRYDTRLLLAHMARLDRLAESERASEDAARFDELLALLAGVKPNEELVVDEDGLPLSRAKNIELAMSVARDIAADAAQEDGDFKPDPAAPFLAATEAAVWWDDWRNLAHAAVDRLLGEPADGTPSTVSTSPLAATPARGQPEASGRGTC